MKQSTIIIIATVIMTMRMMMVLMRMMRIMMKMRNTLIWGRGTVNLYRGNVRHIFLHPQLRVREGLPRWWKHIVHSACVRHGVAMGWASGANGC